MRHDIRLLARPLAIKPFGLPPRCLSTTFRYFAPNAATFTTCSCGFREKNPSEFETSATSIATKCLLSSMQPSLGNNARSLESQFDNCVPTKWSWSKSGNRSENAVAPHLTSAPNFSFRVSTRGQCSSSTSSSRRVRSGLRYSKRTVTERFPSAIPRPSYVPTKVAPAQLSLL